MSDDLFKVEVGPAADVDDLKALTDWLKEGGYDLNEKPRSATIYVEADSDE